MRHVVTVEFTVEAEDEVRAVAAVVTALEAVRDSLNHNPHADEALASLSSYIPRRVELGRYA